MSLLLCACASVSILLILSTKIDISPPRAMRAEKFLVVLVVLLDWTFTFCLGLPGPEDYPLFVVGGPPGPEDYLPGEAEGPLRTGDWQSSGQAGPSLGLLGLLTSLLRAGDGGVQDRRRGG